MTISLNKIAATAQILGVNEWNLKTGSYNGEVFFLSQSIIDKINVYNPAAGVIDSVSSLFGKTEEGNTKLGYGTMIKTTDMSDKGKAKVQVFSLPNNKDVFEDMGWHGETISLTCVIAGPNYEKANRNFFFKAMNPEYAGVDKTGKTLKYVLVHPVWGRIENVRLMEYERIYKGSLWRANAWKLTFRTAEPLFKMFELPVTNYDFVKQKAANILAIAQSILGTYGAVILATKLISNTVTRISLESSANNAIAGVPKLITNFVPDIVDEDIISPSYNSDYVLPQMNYFDSMSPSDVNSLVSLVATEIDVSIEILESENSNLFYPLITNLQSITSDFGSLASSVMDSYNGSSKEYLVPYDMSMFILCGQNNLNYNDFSSVIFNLNVGIIYSYNYIPKGLTLTIPTVG